MENRSRLRSTSTGRWPWACCLLAGLLVAVHSTATCCFAEDVVRLRGPRGQGEQRVIGEVLEYTGEGLRIRRSSGREERYDAERVIEIQSDWNQPHQSAEQLLADRRPAEALPLLRQAMAEEQRNWVRRQLLARQVVAYRQAGELEQAVAAFAALVQSDPGTPHFSVIPLCWPNPLPSASLDARARGWLDHPSRAVQLLGASWSLTSPQRPAAIRTLQQLAESTDPRIAYLARCQLWRTELPTVTERNLIGWREVIQRMPSDLRAGPTLLLAQGLARTGQTTEAAIEFLRLPILYAEQFDLAAEGLWGAGQQLEAARQTDEAMTLYRELIADHPDHLHVSRAQRRVENLSATIRRPTKE
jgi:tetratricopeptide (TPR) repeat protein